MGNKTQIINL